MSQFTFFKVSGTVAISSFDIEDFATIDQAERHAATMLAKSPYEAVEISQRNDCSFIKCDQKGEGGPSIR